MPVSRRITGVYAIRNKINTKLYIGSGAVSVAQRFAQHKSSLRNNKHYSGHLQQAWNKYGEENFEFIVVEECVPEDCLILEQYYIDYYDVCNPNFGYNSAVTAGSTLGFKFSEEAKTKISIALKGKTKGRKHTAEHSANISKALKGKPKSPEHCAKLKGNTHGRVNKGRKMTQEWIEKRQHSRKTNAIIKKLHKER